MSAPSPVELDRPAHRCPRDEQTDDLTFVDRPWVTIVWNDPVNLMSYVSFVFQTYFHYSQAQGGEADARGAQGRDGRWSRTGSREEMERDVQAMHEHGLWATMEKDPT